MDNSVDTDVSEWITFTRLILEGWSGLMQDQALSKILPLTLMHQIREHDKLVHSMVPPPVIIKEFCIIL